MIKFTFKTNQKLLIIKHTSYLEPDVVLCSVSVIRLQHKTVMFACFLSGWATTTGRLLGPKVKNSIKCLSQGHATRYRIGSRTKFRNISITSPALDQLNHATAATH